MLLLAISFILQLTLINCLATNNSSKHKVSLNINQVIYELNANYKKLVEFKYGENDSILYDYTQDLTEFSNIFYHNKYFQYELINNSTISNSCSSQLENLYKALSNKELWSLKGINY